MGPGNTSLPLVGLIAQTLERLTSFGRLTAELAAAELSYGLAGILRGLVFGVVALAIFVMSLVFLCLGAVHAIIAAGVATDLAFFAVGGGQLVLCVILILVARGSFSHASPIPRRAFAELKSALKKAAETTPHA